MSQIINSHYVPLQPPYPIIYCDTSGTGYIVTEPFRKRIAISHGSDSLYWAIKRLATKRGAAAFVFFFFLMTPFWKEKVCGSCGCSV
jgi:hypothetical protein